MRRETTSSFTFSPGMMGDVQLRVTENIPLGKVCQTTEPGGALSRTAQSTSTWPSATDRAPYLAALIASSCRATAIVRAVFGSSSAVGPPIRALSLNLGAARDVSCLSCERLKT
jgi:hypothetical protein